MNNKSQTVRVDIEHDQHPYVESKSGFPDPARFYFLKPTLSIGRSKLNDIVLRSEKISRIHAYIKKIDERWYIEDNDSRNGMYINNKKFKKSLLIHGDEIKIGDFIFIFIEPPKIQAIKHKKNNLTQHQNIISYFKKYPYFIYTFILATLIFLSIKNIIETSIKKEQKGDLAKDTSETQSMPFATPYGGKELFDPKAMAPTREINKIPEANTHVTPPPTPTPTLFPLGEKTLGRNPILPPSSSVNPTKENFIEVEPVPLLQKEALQFKKKKKPIDTKKRTKFYIEKGEQYLKKKNYEMARISFEFALVESPHNKRAILDLKRAYEKINEKTKYKKILQKKEVKIENLKSMLSEANQYFEKRLYTKAIETAQKVIDKSTNFEEKNKAKEILEKAEIKQKEDFYPFLKQAMEKIQQGDYKAAEVICQEMVKTDPDFAPAKDCLQQIKK